MLANIRTQYPALQNLTYLNSCSSGLFSKELLEFRRQLDEDFQQKGSNFRAGVYDKIWAVKETIGTVFGAVPERMALVPSCSHGINLVLEALEGPRKVLQLRDDYPSIVWPFQSRNHEWVTIENKAYSVEEWVSYIQAHNIDLLAVSAVQYSSGDIISPATFKAIKAQCPELLIFVDGTQFWGIAPFNFEESGIDLFAASAFKWLCAGYGNGVVFLSKKLEQALHSRTRGYNTYKNSRMEGTPTTGELFEPGHQDLLAFKSLQFQVEQHQAIGYDQIQAQIQKVKNLARHRFETETDFSIRTTKSPEMESGILSIDAPKELVKHLNAHQVVCSYNRGLRLGIHFYNVEEDVDRMFQLFE